MYRYSDWQSGLRPDFWRVFYEHPDLLKLFAFIHAVQAANSGGYQMLEMYDIVDIGEHNPGHTVTWVPIDLVTNSYVAGHDYPYQFPVDEKWIYIDCLHDTRIDPTVSLQTIVDFRLIDHKICFIKLPAFEKMYISKGLYAGTRLADDYGTAFGYERPDSVHYRDTIVPLMALFYQGPTLHNIISSANVMINNPVAKYGDEKIINTEDGDVITDSYRYDLAGAHLAYNVGDTIRKHSPFADVIEFSTEKTHPSWWLERLPQLFQKYKVDGAISADQRDILMDTFLKYYIAHIRINLNKTDWRKYEFFSDIWNLLLDGSPVRTDYILSMYYHAYDLDMPLPNLDVAKVKLTAFSMWGGRKVPGSEHWLYAPEIVKPTIYQDGTTNNDWYVGSLRYHILDADKKAQEFWSSEPKQLSYVEPHISSWYGRFTTTPNIPLVSKRVLNTGIPAIQQMSIGAMLKRPLVDNTGAATEVISYIPEDTNVCTYYTRSVYGDQNISHEDLDEWTYNNVHLGIEGLVVNIGNTGNAVSPPLDVGGVPKNVRLSPVIALAKGTSILFQYGLGGGTWFNLPDDHIVRGVSNDIYFKVTITASAITSPVFKGVDISIRL